MKDKSGFLIPEITLPSCARCSGHRHSEGEALGGETENLLQIKQFSILRYSKGAVFSSMYVTAHLIDFITIILGCGGITVILDVLKAHSYEHIKKRSGISPAPQNYLLNKKLTSDSNVLMPFS